MSNIFLAGSLIYLACKEGGGIDPTTNTCNDEGITVHGMKPSALISNIAVASGLLAALLMPIIGAIIDYTPRRKFVGIASAIVLGCIQAVQIGTVEVRRTNSNGYFGSVKIL
jgi:MFS-type transporter involved in bile tolerance (Atg22 family)